MEKDVIHYRIHGLELTLHPAAYTVEVRKGTFTDTEDCPADLPEWVFDPNITIWFLGDIGPFPKRAQAGERIRQRILRELQRQKEHDGK